MTEPKPALTTQPAAQDTATSAAGVQAYVQNLPTWSLVLTVMVLIALGVLIIRWRKRRADGVVAGEAPSTPLTTIWEQFRRDLPIEARFLPVIIVLGRPRVGKTHLVQSQLDWEGLDRQLFPSATSDPRMQCYVGRDAIVQEIGWALLKEKGAEVERQLLDLWKPLFTDHAPTVVLVVDAAHPGSPDELRELAGYVRGKMNLLAKIRHAAPALRLCFSHMDELPGYGALSMAIGRRRTTVSLELESNVSDQQLMRALSPLEAWLGQVLAADKPDDFKRGVQMFAQQLPGLSRAITPLLRELATPVYLSRSLEVRDVSLSGLSPTDGIGAPLAVDVREATQAVNQWTRRHMITAAALAGGAIVTATGLLYWHHSSIKDAETAVREFNDTATNPAWDGGDPIAAENVLAAERHAAELLHTVQAWDEIFFFHGTYSNRKTSLYNDFSQTARKFYIEPRLSPLENSETILRAAALTRANSHNALGEMISEDSPTWAKGLRLQESVIKDYISISLSTCQGKLNVRVPDGQQSILTATQDFKRWESYFDRLHGDYEHGSITRQRLVELQADTTQLLKVVTDAASWKEMRSIAAKLESVCSSDMHDIEPLLGDNDVKLWVLQNRTTLESLLKMVKNTSIGSERDIPKNLMGLLDGLAAPSTVVTSPGPSQSHLTTLLAALAASPAPGSSEQTYELTLPSNTYSFGSKAWADVIVKSRSSLLVDGFITKPRPGSFAFFASKDLYPTAGGPAIEGKGPSKSIQGIFTRAAFNAEVAPALEAYATKLDTLPLSSDDRDKLDAFVTLQVREYAQAYGNALKDYYASFQLQSGSAAVFRHIAAELSMPNSFLATFLAAIADNANLTLKNDTHFQTFANQLETFKPIVMLMKDGAPKLAKYAETLAPLSVLPTSTNQVPGSPLADRVSPLGQAALSMLRSDKDSVQLAVQSWLAAEGIRGSNATPFLLPVQIAYGYGISEVQEAIASAWQNEVYPDVSPMLSKFPFNGKADTEVEPSELTAVFVPLKGRFWQRIVPIIQPVCTPIGIRWKPVEGPYGSAKFPANMLEITNGAARMGQVLWNKDGKPQPIAVTLRPEPLPTVAIDQAVPTMAVFRTGMTTSFAFNQKASWETVEIQWDEQGDSSIELQMGTPDTKRKFVRTIDGSGGAWSFYRLLAKATTTRTGPTIWKFAVTAGDPVVPVSYAIRGAPWEPFQLSARGD